MSAFQAAYEVLRHVAGDVEADRLLVAVENEKLNEAIAAARSEYLHDHTGTPEDEAYNQGVSDAVAAIGALLNTAPSGSTAEDEQPEASPWQRAVEGLNALVDAGIGFHVEPDGHISNPFGGEHIEWDHSAERWQLTVDDEAEVL